MTSRQAIAAIFIQCCLNWLSPTASALSLQWAQEIGSIENKQTAFDSSADPVGNVYLSGKFGDTDPSISKYDSAGELLWIREGGFTTDSARGIYVSNDRLGNAYLAGSTYGDLGGPAMASGDVILKKYDAAGNLQWSRQFGTSTYDYVNAVSTDEPGNSYVTGSTFGQLGDTYFGGQDAFISKHDSAGNLLWIRQFGTAVNESARGISVDTLGNVFVAGTQGTASPNNLDIFLRKFDVDGNLQWSRQFGSPGFESLSRIATDGLGNVYLSGQTNGDLGSMLLGEFDAFIAKYDAEGNSQWLRQYGTLRFDAGFGVAADPNGVYVSGQTTGDLYGINAGPRDTSDSYVARFDAAGNLESSYQFGTAGSGEGSTDVSINEIGNAYIVGNTNFREGYVARLFTGSGDFNHDGEVNAADYTVWRNGLGVKYSPDDYDVWKSHFGTHAGGSGSGGAAGVPEPATLGLFVLGMLTMISLQRRTVS